MLRSDGEDGFLAVIFLFVVVWTTDIAAYFIGRAAGGPKLLPQVSPNKTWSGAIGGTLAAVVVALALAKTAAFAGLFAIAMLAIVLSVSAQAGDMFESFLKRRFGAKDSGHLIPGHGGLMDRLDGFVTASVVAALIGLRAAASRRPDGACWYGESDETRDLAWSLRSAGANAARAHRDAPWRHRVDRWQHRRSAQARARALSRRGREREQERRRIGGAGA